MPATIGSGTIASTAITGNPPAGQRGKVAVVPRYKVRVVDPVSGAEVIGALPYTHASEFETIFPQSGMAGSSAVGHFTIHLYHPLTDEYAWAKTWYDKLDHLQRVEFYQIDEDGVGASGDPVFTGIIQALPKEDTSYRIEGLDSLAKLDLSRTLSSDTFNGTTDQLVRYALKTYQEGFIDDFTTDLSGYTNNGTWSLTTDQGFKSVKAGYAGDGLLFTTSSFANTKYADCFIEAPFHLVCASTAGASADAGIIAAVTDANNLILGEANMRFVAAATATVPAQYAIDAAIWQKSGGVYTAKSVIQGIIVETTNTAQLTITLIGVQTTATTYTWRVLVNEIDSNCTWVQSLSSGSPTGAIGLRSTVGTSTVAQHHLVFFSKANIFQVGNVATGSQRVKQPIPSQSNIDLLQLAASTEGFAWRKRPKAGLNNDQIDFALSVGGDLSGIVRLEQDFTIIASQTERNAEQLNTAVLTLGQAGYNGIGIQRWYDIATIKTRGLIIGPAIALRPPEPYALRQMAQNILLKRKQPTQAKRMTVLRSEDHAELPNQPSPTGLAYREGDWVTQHEPRKGIYYQRVQIMSAKCTEGVPVLELTLDQYPILLDRAPLVDRMNRLLEDAQMRVGDATQTNLDTGVKRDTRTVLPINPWKMRAYVTAAQSIPDNAITLVNYDTVDFDTSNSFSTTAHTFTAPIAGYYVVAACAAFALAAILSQLQYWYALIYKNGAQNQLGQFGFYQQLAGVASSRIVQGSVTDTMYLNAGDVLDIRLLANMGAAVPLQAGTSLSYWSVHLISG